MLSLKRRCLWLKQVERGLAACLCLGLAACSGTTCTIRPNYSHPVTGEVMDSGSTGSSATGQGMVEGTIDKEGILEQAD